MGRHLRAKPRILLDCDGVLSDFSSRVVQLINEELNTSYTVQDITAWDFVAALGLDPETGLKIKKKIGNTRGFAASLQPYPGTIEAVKQLRIIADVYIVTSPWNSNQTWVWERECWLSDHFGIKYSSVMHGSAKYLCGGDFFVDDKVEALVKWQKEHPDNTAIKWQTPHNRNEPWSGTILDDWDALISLVKAWKS